MAISDHPTKGKPSILWLRRDLRLSDNHALSQALQTGGPVVVLFIFDEHGGEPERLGGAARWWLHHSLTALSTAIEATENRLILRAGPVEDVLTSVIEETGAESIFANRLYSPCQDRADLALQTHFEARDIRLHFSEGHLLHPPGNITTQSGQPFKVFTPFWRSMASGSEPAFPLDAPDRIPAPSQFPPSDDLDDWGLLPTQPDWAAEFGGEWQPGEAAALQRLDDFLSADVKGYALQRDFPALDSATSRLSAHLAFGEISPSTIWHGVSKAPSTCPREDLTTFRKELAWRDFCYGLFAIEPDLAEKNWNKDFDRFEWQMDESAFAAWKAGQTGYPIVDAGMRQLWRHGIMHNRIRMVVASFLIKHLLIDWRHGEKWFCDTLVDFDVANNPANWQWVAGSGADASPFFRIFNPVLQGEKFDRQGDYVRRFVPELAHMEARYIHRPFDAPLSVLEKAGVTLGQTYPKPIIDHQFARQRALAAYGKIKKGD